MRHQPPGQRHQVRRLRRPAPDIDLSEAINGQVRLWFEDEGIGIPEEAQTQIFKPFSRLHGQDRYPGTGLGLAIVRKAVERMRGSVGVKSAPGKGSRFWITLPRA